MAVCHLYRFPAITPLADAGKFPLRDAYLEGRAQALQDRGFASSQDAALPELWFEAGEWRGLGGVDCAHGFAPSETNAA